MFDGLIGDDLRAQLEAHRTKHTRHPSVITFVRKKHDPPRYFTMRNLCTTAATLRPRVLHYRRQLEPSIQRVRDLFRGLVAFVAVLNEILNCGYGNDAHAECRAFLRLFFERGVALVILFTPIQVSLPQTLFCRFCRPAARRYKPRVYERLPEFPDLRCLSRFHFCTA